MPIMKKVQCLLNKDQLLVRQALLHWAVLWPLK